MQLSRRATKRTTATAIIAEWRVRDDNLSIQEIRSLYGLPTYYLVVRHQANGNEAILSRHRKRAAAVKALP